MPRAWETSEGGKKKTEGRLSRLFSAFATEKMIDLVINGGAHQDSTAAVAVGNQPGENSPGPVTPTAVRKAAPSSAGCLTLPTSARVPGRHAGCSSYQTEVEDGETPGAWRRRIR